ncbi:hypothetical protein D3C77_756470 [compost metagenome]
MAEAGIHRHAGAGAGDDPGDTNQVQLGQNLCLIQTGGDALGAGLFLRIAPG